ncbi:MAG: hypothetical protein ABI808_16180 [Pseudonocardiales bacterium]
MGYVLGAKAGEEGFEEVVDSVNAIRKSDEFHSLAKVLRAHTSHVLREIAKALDEESEQAGMTELLERARKLTQGLIPTARAS